MEKDSALIKELLFGGAGGASKLADVGLLILRVFTGLALAVSHGLDKVQDPSGVIAGSRGLGLPAPTIFGWAAALSEFLGGLLLALGLLTRPAAVFIAVTMGIAAFLVHGDDPFSKKELALLYLAPVIALMLAGAGRFSIDRLIRK